MTDVEFYEKYYSGLAKMMFKIIWREGKVVFHAMNEAANVYVDVLMFKQYGLP